MGIEELLRELNAEITENTRKMDIIKELKLRCNSKVQNEDHADDYVRAKGNFKELLKVVQTDKNYEVRKGIIEILKNFIEIGDTDSQLGVLGVDDNDDTAEQITKFLVYVIQEDEYLEVKKAAVDVLGVVVKSNKSKAMVNEVVPFLLDAIEFYGRDGRSVADEAVRESIATVFRTANFVVLFRDITDDKLIKKIIKYMPFEASSEIQELLNDKKVATERRTIIFQEKMDYLTLANLIYTSTGIALQQKKYSIDNADNLQFELMKAMYEYNRDIPGLIESIYIEEKKGDNGNYKEMIRSFAKFLEEDGYIYNPKPLSKAGIANFVNRCIAILFKLVGKKWKYEPRIGVKSDVEASKIKESIQKFKKSMQQPGELNMKGPDKGM